MSYELDDGQKCVMRNTVIEFIIIIIIIIIIIVTMMRLRGLVIQACSPPSIGLRTPAEY